MLNQDPVTNANTTDSRSTMGSSGKKSDFNHKILKIYVYLSSLIL